MDSITSPTKSESKPFTVLFVGSNPSNASAIDQAFHGTTQSSKILARWCKDISGLKVHINVINKKTEGNRPLKTSEIKAGLNNLSQTIGDVAPDRIVALGKTATKALTLLRVNFYEMPHPSGKNRVLNDKKFEEQKIKGLTEFCTL